MRYRPRTDQNQAKIVAALRAVGANVISLASIGKGCPDLLVQYRGNLYLMEIKDGTKTDSRRKLTPDEIRFKAIWDSSVVHSVDEAFRAIGAIK
jgi:hypothetical protein